MNMNMTTCRLCHKTNYEDRSAMVRVGTRHNVHWKCKLERLRDKEARIAWLRTLTPYQLAQAPALLMDANGLFEFVTDAIKLIVEAKPAVHNARCKDCGSTGHNTGSNTCDGPRCVCGIGDDLLDISRHAVDCPMRLAQ